MERLVLVLILGMMACGCVQDDAQRGTLDGRVSLHSLCKNPPCDTSPARMSAEYAQRKIIIDSTTPGDKTRIVNLSDDGTYRVDLVPGLYIVDIDYGGRGKSYDVPSKVRIETNKTVHLNIDVDLRLSQG
jgi:hypothetical protein